MKKLSGVVAIIIVAFGGWNFLHWAYQKALTTAKDPTIKVRAEDLKVRPFTLLVRQERFPALYADLAGGRVPVVSATRMKDDFDGQRRLVVDGQFVEGPNVTVASETKLIADAIESHFNADYVAVFYWETDVSSLDPSPKPAPDENYLRGVFDVVASKRAVGLSHHASSATRSVNVLDFRDGHPAKSDFWNANDHDEVCAPMMRLYDVSMETYRKCRDRELRRR